MSKFKLNINKATGKGTGDFHTRLGVSDARKKFFSTLAKKMIDAGHDDIALVIKVAVEQCESLEEVVLVTYMIAFFNGTQKGILEGKGIQGDGLKDLLKNLGGGGDGKISGGFLDLGKGPKGLMEFISFLKKMEDDMENGEDDDDNPFRNEDDDDDDITDPRKGGGKGFDIDALIRESIKINGKPGEQKPD